MRTRGKNRLAQLGEDVLGGVPDAETPTVPKSNRVDRREQAALGAPVPVARPIGPGGTVREIDPSRVRLWADHNRDYEALSEASCRDLIDSVRAHGQKLPAVGRPAQDDPDIDLELVVGARRLWTARYLARPLLVEIRTLGDRDAFLLMDLENRNREDISDLERARDYRGALARHFGSNTSRMAESLSIDRPNFTRLLALAELPTEIVEAYADPRELRVHHGAEYAKLMKDRDARRRLLAEAKRLKGQGMDGRKVVKALRASAAAVSAAAPRPASKPRRRGAVSWKPSPKGKGNTVSFDVRAGIDTEALGALRRDIDAVLEQLTGADPDG